MLTEDDTFKRLKSITCEEAWVIYNEIGGKYFTDLTKNLWDEANLELVKYGWTVERLMKT